MNFSTKADPINLNSESEIDSDDNDLKTVFGNLKQANDDDVTTSSISRFTRTLEVAAVEIRTFGTEYPPTSPSGIAIIYPRRIEDQPQEPWEMMQYSRTGGYGNRKTKIPYFNNITGAVTKRNCNGVKICEHIRPELGSMTHEIRRYRQRLSTKYQPLDDKAKNMGVLLESAEKTRSMQICGRKKFDRCERQ